MTSLDSFDGKVGEEERGGVSKLLDIDKKTWSIVKFDNKWSSKLWAAMGKTPKGLFKHFRLDGAGEKIDEKRKIIQWFRYAQDYRVAKGTYWLPDFEIYSILSGTSEAKRALLFQSLKEIPDLKDLATIMQNYQFKLWIDRGESPRTVAKMLGFPKRIEETVTVDQPNTLESTDEQRAAPVPNELSTAVSKVTERVAEKVFHGIQKVAGQSAAEKVAMKVTNHVSFPILYRMKTTPDYFLIRAKQQVDPIKRLMDEEAAKQFAAWIAKNHP
ncbi:Avirulence (Avh) protein [Phytophthora megakarya]|uniref:Avirulence (Avh) protein n=1 Tax=Phytophthora megakarya TaxID=4795 RepID=A0A225WTA8_9STRA|nr:Avirulence (Avh) protein [Phytophthora megakarya]